jgi:hypothetical protein
MRKLKIAVLFAALAVLPSATAHAHGGGGGGGGHGGSGHYVYIPVYGGQAVMVVPPAQTADYSRIHSVAVISGIGQTLTLGKAALLTTHSTLSIADWNLDQGVETTLAHYLSGGFMVKTVPHDSAVLANIPNGHFDTSSAKALQAYIQALQAKDVDAFIVVRPDAELGTPITPGLSLDATGSTTRPEEEVNFEIDVVDAQSGTIIAHAFSRAADRQGVAAQFAAFWGSKDVKVMPNGTPTDAQRNQMKADFERNVSLSLRETLRALSLAIPLPEVGARNIVTVAPDQSPFRKLSKVMVISTLGDHVEVHYPGGLFTKTKDTLTPVSDWNLDAEFEKHAADALDKHFVPASVPVDRAKLASLTVGMDQKLDTLPPVDGISPGAGVDLYVMLVKLRTKPVGGISGLAMWDTGADFADALVDYAIALVDPKTARIVFLHRGVTSPKFPSELPMRVTMKANMPNPGAGFSPEQASTLHTLYSGIMADSIPETLLRMELTGRKIEAGGGDLADASVDGAAQTEPAPRDAGQPPN